MPDRDKANRADASTKNKNAEDKFIMLTRIMLTRKKSTNDSDNNSHSVNDLIIGSTRNASRDASNDSTRDSGADRNEVLISDSSVDRGGDVSCDFGTATDSGFDRNEVLINSSTRDINNSTRDAGQSPDYHVINRPTNHDAMKFHDIMNHLTKMGHDTMNRLMKMGHTMSHRRADTQLAGVMQ